MKRYTTVLVILALIMSFVSIAAIAQPFGGGGPGGGKSFRGGPGGGQDMLIGGLRNLDLTDDQRDQIKTILDEHREVMQADCDVTREDMDAIKDELASLMDSEVYDEDAARQILTEKFQINTEKQILRQKVHHQILWEVLTAEQRETLAEQRANDEALGRGFRQDRSARRRF